MEAYVSIGFFAEYSLKTELEFDQLHSRTKKEVLEQGDHLDHRKQAWKGLSYRIVSPIDEWSKPDFPQFVAMKFISFVETMLPVLEDFEKMSNKEM